jgi:hypothetical protein
MSFDLVNQSTEIRRKFSRQSWAKTLQLAGSYGWQPLGTQPPAFFDFLELNAEWTGSYFTNDGQVVMAEDSRLLAAALERSLPDIPDLSCPMTWDAGSWREDDLPEWLSPAERALIEETLQDGLLDIVGIPPLDFFAGMEKRRLIDFIRFCRLGSFEIL